MRDNKNMRDNKRPRRTTTPNREYKSRSYGADHSLPTPSAPPKAPVIDITELKVKKIAELASIAKDLNVANISDLRKQELILKIVEAQTQRQNDPNIDGLIASGGVLEVLPDGYGFLRSQSYNYLP